MADVGLHHVRNARAGVEVGDILDHARGRPRRRAKANLAGVAVGHVRPDEDRVHALRHREHGALPAKALGHALLARDAVHQRRNGRTRAHEALHRIERFGHPRRLDRKDHQVDGLGLARGHGAHATRLAVHGHDLAGVARVASIVHHVPDGTWPEVLLGNGAVEQAHRSPAQNRHALDRHVAPFYAMLTSGVTWGIELSSIVLSR